MRRMIPEERREKIIQRLQSNKFYTLDKLKNDLGVSRVTIQRDVNLLEENGFVDKVHGGVRLKKPNVDFFETRFRARLNQNYEKKMDIARKAVGYVNDSSTIFIDSSTTCYIFAKELFKKKFIDLNLITNSPTLACELPEKSSIRVISTGGLLRKDFNMFYGDWVIDFLNKINIDAAFTSAAGVSVENGITSSDSELTNILRTVFERSSESNLLVDSSKFNKLGLLKISDIQYCNKIITDDGVSKEIVDEFISCNTTQLIY